jgi:hypothetical protein
MFKNGWNAWSSACGISRRRGSYCGNESLTEFQVSRQGNGMSFACFPFLFIFGPNANWMQHIQYAKGKSDIIAKLDGTYRIRAPKEESKGTKRLREEDSNEESD